MSKIRHSPRLDRPVLLARMSLYRFAALTLLDPEADAWRVLRQLREEAVLSGAASLITELPAADVQSLAPGERPLSDLQPTQGLACLPETSATLNGEFEDTFGLLVSKACPPHETEYIGSKFSFQRSNALADVSGFYRAFGLTTSAMQRERPDHIVQELELLAFLICHELNAGEQNQPGWQQRAEICHDAQVRFLGDHLAWWAPAFAKLLGREACGEFYPEAGRFLAALIPVDRGLLGVDPPARHAEPSLVEVQEQCEGCELAG